MFATLAAAAVPALIEGAVGLFGNDQAEDQARRAAAERTAAAQQLSSDISAGYDAYGNEVYEAGKNYAGSLEDAYEGSTGFYDDARGALSPYAEAGLEGNYSGELVDQILGKYGASGADAALAAYQQGPSSQLLQNVLADVARREGDRYASLGLRNSGAFVESLGRRTADLALGDYRNWQSLATRTAEGDKSRGLQAANALAGINERQGNNRQTTYGQSGYLRNYLAPTSRASAKLQGTLGSANALASASTNNANALSQLPTTAEALAKPAGNLATHLYDKL